MKVQCQKCKNCKMIYGNNKVVCSYLNDMGGLYRPKYCPEFNLREKKGEENGEENGDK